MRTHSSDHVSKWHVRSKGASKLIIVLYLENDLASHVQIWYVLSNQLILLHESDMEWIVRNLRNSLGDRAQMWCVLFTQKSDNSKRPACIGGEMNSHVRKCPVEFSK